MKAPDALNVFTGIGTRAKALDPRSTDPYTALQGVLVTVVLHIGDK